MRSPPFGSGFGGASAVAGPTRVADATADCAWLVTAPSKHPRIGERTCRVASGGLASPYVSLEIRPADRVDDELVAAFAGLIPQLSSSSPPPDADELSAIVDSPDSVLFVARVDGEIVGSLTLAFYRIPTGLKAWIEDVVVDASARGHGVGEALNRAAIAEAAHRGAKNVSLTSRPSREAANRLYRRLGFEPNPTNLYRYDT